MGKCLEIRYFLSKFHSEGEFLHCHNPGNQLGLTNQTNNANLGSKNKKMCKVRPYTIPTVLIQLNHSGWKWDYFEWKRLTQNQGDTDKYPVIKRVKE